MEFAPDAPDEAFDGLEEDPASDRPDSVPVPLGSLVAVGDGVAAHQVSDTVTVILTDAEDAAA